VPRPRRHPGGTYLRARGIDPAQLPGGVPPTLRYHGGLKHADTGLVFPAMVAAVQAVDGRVAGIHRTFLKPDGSARRRSPAPRRWAGVLGGCIRLCWAEARMGLAEGIETALSVMAATGLPTWAADRWATWRRRPAADRARDRAADRRRFRPRGHGPDGGGGPRVSCRAAARGARGQGAGRGDWNDILRGAK